MMKKESLQLNSVIFTDFDGVLFDSVKEAYILSRYAYDGIDFKVDIDENEYAIFREFRYLITHSWHFYYIFKLIKKEISFDVFENEYLKILPKKISNNAREFDLRYVDGRKKLVKEDFDFWDSLDKPFLFFEKLIQFQKKTDRKIVVLTNKKRQPVEDKLKKYKADNFELFANEDLVNYKTKAEFIQKYIQKNNFNQAFLIEDSIDNINACKGYSAIKSILVDWGYVSPKNKGIAIEEVLNILQEVL